MSQENVELTRRAFDALHRRDLDEFVAFHDPSCEIQPLLAAVAGDYHGCAGVREWLDDLLGAFPDFSIRLDDVREVGDRTLARARISAHGAHGMDSAGPMIDQVSWVLSEIRNGRVIWWGTFRTEREALEAAGLSEGAMLQENVETVARLYNECWALGRLELVPEILHPDIVWTAIESAPDSGTRRGQAECRAYMNDWLESFDLKPVPIEEARSAPDGQVVCALHGVGTEKRTGLTTDIRYGAAFGFAPDGRLVEIHEYATHPEALEAVGLSD